METSMKELASMLEQGMNVDDVRSLSRRSKFSDDSYDEDDDDNDGEDRSVGNYFNKVRSHSEDKESDESNIESDNEDEYDQNYQNGNDKDEDEDTEKVALDKISRITIARTSVTLLSDADLKTLLLVKLGMTAREVKGLSRYDRENVIHFAAKEARRQGRDRHLWSYAPPHSENNDIYSESSSSLSSAKKCGRTTSSDELNDLSMAELEYLLVQLRVSAEDVRDMSRWDRIKVIEFAATEAKRMGYCSRLWPYASK